MELYDAMRSIPTQRRFLRDPVPEAVLHRVLEHARFAASGGNRQGWRVVVVRDGGLKAAVRDLYREPFAELMRRAREGAIATGLDPATRSRTFTRAERFAERLDDVPVLLVLTAELAALELTDAALDRPSLVGGASVYNFMQNIVLGCRNEGLGTAVTTLLAAREPQARALLGIPEGHAVAAMLAVGYPDPGHLVRRLSRRPVEAFATIDRFDGAPLTAGAPA